MTHDVQIANLVAQFKELCATRMMMVATAESCTGGMIAAALTSIPGSSQFFERGFITYTNQSKTEVLGVPFDLIDLKGAVSGEVAIAMANGALRHSQADLAIAVTGIAGPGGATPDKLVGRVHVAIGFRKDRYEHRQLDFGDIGRASVRERTVIEALKFAVELLS